MNVQDAAVRQMQKQAGLYDRTVHKPNLQKIKQ